MQINAASFDRTTSNPYLLFKHSDIGCLDIPAKHGNISKGIAETIMGEIPRFGLR